MSGSAATTSRVLAQLRRFIETGAYQPGSKLPPERTLATELQVGRPAVREALKALSILDVLESRRGDGTYVKSLTALNAGWPAVLEVAGDFSMLELLELRKMIEPRAASLAAARASESDLRQIERLRQSLEDNSISWKRVVDLDFRLHASIIEAAGNSILAQVHRFLSPYLRSSREITARATPTWDRMRCDHAAIVQAIMRGESGVAEEAMLEHMHHIGLDLVSKRKR